MTSERGWRAYKRRILKHHGDSWLIRFRNSRWRRWPMDGSRHGIEDLRGRALRDKAFVILATKEYATAGRVEREKVLTPRNCTALLILLLEKSSVSAEKSCRCGFVCKLQANQEKRLLAGLALINRVTIAGPGRRQLLGA